MTDLSPEAKQLIEGVKPLEAPINGAKERVWAGVHKSVGSVAASDASAAPTTNGAPVISPLVRNVVVASAVLVLGGGIGMWAWHGAAPGDVIVVDEQQQIEYSKTTRRGESSRPSLLELETTVVELNSTEQTTPSEAVRNDENNAKRAFVDNELSQRGSPQKNAKQKESQKQLSNGAGAPSTLQDEIGLLQQAQRARKEARFSDAVAVLKQHQKRFPKGVLKAERDAALVMVYCDSGKTKQAAKGAKAFLALYSTSPLAHSVKTSCAFTKEK